LELFVVVGRRHLKAKKERVMDAQVRTIRSTPVAQLSPEQLVEIDLA